jgi:undecaprenyl-diphosphatase
MPKRAHLRDRTVAAMVELLKAAALGVVQGLTEFLPVSSSGHLILMRDVLGWEMLADQHLNKVFDVALHAGTFFSLVIYFWPDVVRLLSAFAASVRHGINGDTDRRIAWLIVIGTVPAAVAGLAAQEVIETTLGTPMLVAGELVVFAFVLWLAERWGRKQRVLSAVTWWDGILVGAAQAVALAPGVSRSGITITAGLARGMKREAAARFSFLLSIPIVGGTAAYSFAGLIKNQAAMPSGGPAMFAVGMVAAAASGYLCIHYFLRYLQTRSLTPFVIYRIGLGLALLGCYGLIW